VTENISETANFSIIPISGGVTSGGGGCGLPDIWNAQRLACQAPTITAPLSIVSTPAPVVVVSSPVNQILGSGTCPASLIITDSMRLGDTDGIYDSYNAKTVTQVDILQKQINRILAASYTQAAGPTDGIFGPLTKKGVARLQTALNSILKPNPTLLIDGIVGPFTRKAINNSCGK